VKTKGKPAFALEDTLAVYGIRNNPFPVGETDDFFFSTPILAKQMCCEIWWSTVICC
jgi:hypothetical protein